MLRNLPNEKSTLIGLDKGLVMSEIENNLKKKLTLCFRNDTKIYIFDKPFWGISENFTVTWKKIP